jgi:Flp pilus assembly protein TadB
MVSSQAGMLRNELGRLGKKSIEIIGKISLVKTLQNSEVEVEASEANVIPQKKTVQAIPKKENEEVVFVKSGKRIKPDTLEKLTFSRIMKKQEKILKIKEKKPRKYVKFASKLFHNFSTGLINKGKFKGLSRDLIQANMEFVPAAYISVIFFTTLLSFIIAIFLTFFFLFFNIVVLVPFIVPSSDALMSRLLKVFWILILVPGATFLFSYLYPSLEKKSIESRINQELPFAVVHMSSIAGSMIEPSKIFGIIISTREYPFLEKEFIKIQNEINVYGYDLVTSLRNRSFNSPSKKLSELFNGLATTINSGGDLSEFFEKRSQSLLFDHRLEKEKQAKASETFMDIYISAVVAAPMILMLLLMMMRISGLGISLSTGMISLIMILGVSLVNVLFLAFLQLKQPEG